ncbi:MAG: hypothetical protein P8M78_02960 [Myxococcota bacterium]|nr:hypothetical protein [Myxococcota bacterium]
MLTAFDDYPIHQTPDPVAVPATTDRHAYDRFWFNGYTDDGELYFGVSGAVYPNLGIMDCGFSLVHDGEQHAFHASKRLGLDRNGIEVGPFRIEIVEPMKRVRITLDPNETGIECDLEWIPRTANFQEGYQRTDRGRGGLHMEATRFNQFGFWKGQIRYANRTLKVDPGRVFGTKDRSWGIRPVGDPAPPGAPSSQVPQVFFLWAPLHWSDRCTHLGLFENEFGVAWHWDGLVMPCYENPEGLPGIEDPAARPLLQVEHALSFVPGTRQAAGGELAWLHADGHREVVRLEPLLCFRMKGIGYSHPEWGHGRWKGEQALGGESWKIDEVAENDPQNLHIQQVIRVESDAGQGIGVLEQVHYGPHRKYGWQSFNDALT